MKIHFIGIGGIGMSSIALHRFFQGYEITGSNITGNERTSHLEKLGINVHIGHDASNLSEDTDLVIVTRAVPKTNPELKKAMLMEIPIMERNDALIEIVKDLHPSIAVTGTDGKTTTTAMIFHVLKKLGENLYGFLGGLHSAFEHGNYSTGNNGVVFELDESTPVFSKYTVDHLVITNSRGDHLENFENDLRVYVKSFIDLIENVKGLVVTFADDELTGELGEVTFGVGRGSYRFLERSANGGHQVFSFQDPKGRTRKVELSVPGFHNCLNALATIALLSSLGFGCDEVVEALRDFQSVHRRFTISFSDVGRKIFVIDDYAHTPEEIESLLKTVKEVFTDEKIVAVFQPHRYSRTLRENGRFSKVLSLADVVYVTSIYGAFEKSLKVTGLDIAEGVQKNGKEAYYFERLNDLIDELPPREHTVYLFIGAGDIIDYSKTFIKRIKALEGVKS